MILGVGLLGWVGLFGMTWLFPVVSRLLVSTTHHGAVSYRNEDPLLPAEPLRLAVLVPAHNEERCISETLASLQASIAEVRRHFPRVQVRVLVGADGCSDKTAQISREQGAEVFEFQPGQGKWRTLNALVSETADVDWIGFADAGVIWERELLSKCLSRFIRPDVIGVAPTYRNPSAGVLESISWAMERFLKRLEDASGGPVSVHGATVFYRRRELLEALGSLDGRTWLNDDVVIPLMLRMLHPELRIHYAADVSVRDSASAHLLQSGSPNREFGRRKRMVLGNVQWMRGILPRGWKTNPGAVFLALRRVFRLFWAYWGLVAALPLAVYAIRVLVTTVSPAVLTATSIAISFPVLAALWRFRRPLMRVADAAVASFMAPFMFFVSEPRTRWK